MAGRTISEVYCQVSVRKAHVVLEHVSAKALFLPHSISLTAINGSHLFLTLRALESGYLTAPKCGYKLPCSLPTTQMTAILKLSLKEEKGGVSL